MTDHDEPDDVEPAPAAFRNPMTDAAADMGTDRATRRADVDARVADLEDRLAAVERRLADLERRG